MKKSYESGLASHIGPQVMQSRSSGSAVTSNRDPSDSFLNYVCALTE